MTTAKYQITDFTSDTPSELKAKLDGNSAVAARIVAAFQCHAADTPDMTVKVAAGSLMVNDALTEVAIQTSGTITAPVTHPRIDRVVIDQISGVASIITGAEAASPSAPAITAGKIPVAQIALATDTTAITNSLITDERPFVLFPSIAGLTEDTTPDLAADYALVWDASAGAMVKVKLNKIGVTTDQVARDQIALTNIKLMLSTAVATGPLVQGKQWELATDTWGATSANETYVAPGSFGYYTNNPGGYGSDLITGSETYSASSTSAGSAANLADGSGATSWTANSATESWWKVDFGTAKTVTKFEYDTYTGSGNSTNVYIEGSNDDSNWTTLDTLGGGYTNGQTYSRTFANTTAYRYYRIRMTWSSANSGGLYEARAYESLSPTNMTLIPDAAVSVSTAPTYMDAYCLWKDDSGSASLGTDLTIELSRDSGTTYTTATLTNLASYDGTYSIIKARADVSGQPSGTSMLCRIKTLNNKAQRIAAPALYAE